MNIFQIMAFLFGLFMLYVVTIHRRKSQLSSLEVSFWYSIWCLFIIISIFPNLLLGIADALHFARVFDLLIVIALTILTLLVVVNYFHQRENGRKLEKLVRKLAMDSVQKPTKL